MGGLKEIFFDYALWTSAHGIPHVARVHTNKARLFWLSVFLASVSIMSWQISQIIQRYFKYEKTTSLRLEVENQQFPAVTVCSLNPYRKSVALSVPGIKDLLEAFEQSTGKETGKISNKNTNQKNSQLPPYVNPESVPPELTTERAVTSKSVNRVEQTFLWRRRKRKAITTKTFPCDCDSRGRNCFMVGDPDSKDDFICACSESGEHCEKCLMESPTESLDQMAERCLAMWGQTETEEMCLCDSERINCRLDTNKPYSSDAVNCYCKLATGECRFFADRRESMSPCICNEEKETCVKDDKPAPETHDICMCTLGGSCRQCPDPECTDPRKHVTPCECMEKDCLYLPEMKIQSSLCYCSFSSNNNCIPCYESNCLQKYTRGWIGVFQTISTSTSFTPTRGPQEEGSKGTGDPVSGLTLPTDPTPPARPVTETPVTIRIGACRCNSLACTSSNLEALDDPLLAPCICDQNLECSGCNNSVCVKVFERLLDSLTTEPPTNPPPPPTTQPPTEAPTPQFTTETPSFGFENEAKDQIANQAKAEKGLIYVAAGLNDSVRNLIGYQKTDFIIQCAFNAKSCDIDKDFTQFSDPTFGNCFSFNKSDESDHAGPVYGLQLILFADTTEYLATSKMAGIRLVVHDRFSRPFPDSTGYNAPTGSAVSYGLRKKQNQRLPKPYGDCVFSPEDIGGFLYSGNYTVEGCFRSCMQRELVRECLCADPQYPREDEDTEYCASNDQIACLQERGSRLQQGGVNCRCPLPCVEVHYDVTISTAAWPLQSSQISGCQEEELLQRFNKTCAQIYKEMAVMVQVYFEQLNQEVVYESPAFPEGALLADIASQVGFWVGVSVLSMVEILVLLSKVLMFCFVEQNTGEGPTIMIARTNWIQRLKSLFGNFQLFNQEIVNATPPDPEQGKASRRMSSMSPIPAPGTGPAQSGNLIFSSPTLSPSPERASSAGSDVIQRGRRGR